MVQWAIELSMFDLRYKTWTAIKDQCLTDFVAEYAGDQEEAFTTWELYVDGSSNKVGSASNNQAEYEALIAGLKLAEEVGATKVVVFSNSQVVTSQINGEYQAKDPKMKRYFDKTLEYLGRFAKTEVKHITRDLNSRADALSKLARPFPQASGQVNYLIVGVDYFTKWIEAEPLAIIIAQRSRKFLYKNIITRYRVPHSITTDNGTQFTDSSFKNLVASMQIKHQFTSVEHPQANGQTEAANKVILAGLMKRLEEAKGAWTEELPQVLWAYRITSQSTTGETPFRLAYGTEAIIPVEINEQSPRVNFYDEVDNVQGHKEELKLLPEV
nr:uncharacterized protein LOC112749238 [Arachis hypogaea]